MRIAVVVALSGALALAACGGSNSKVTTSSTTVAGSTTSASVSTTTVELPTTSLPCQPLATPTGPVTSPVPTQQASLLTNVQILGDACVDHVVFDYTAKGSDLPGYTVSYASPPFTSDASGAPVPVAGSAFVRVKVQPGYGYDFETGKTTYTGPKSIPITHANYVKAIVETGDFEGVLTWVIGLDSKRPFSVQATGTPRHQLVVTIG